MTWFRVDDSFHAHPKVLATDADALGLWVVAGAWSSANLTDGYVSDRALSRLLPDAEVLAAKLVATGLWRRTRGGYRFHDWTSFNPTRSEAMAGREQMASGGALGNHRRWHRDAGVTKPGCPFCDQQKQPSGTRSPTRQQPDGVPDAYPNPPVPVPNKVLVGGAVRAFVTSREPEPPLTCPRHHNNPTDEPCRGCRDARRAHLDWEAAETARLRAAPDCRRHRGQLAHNCSMCRSEALAPEDS